MIFPPAAKRYLEVDENGIAINELTAWGTGTPTAPPGRTIVDVTFRPEARLLHRYDKNSGVFKPPAIVHPPQTGVGGKGGSGTVIGNRGR